MKVQFKQAVHLDGKTYSRGVHEVPEKSLQHPYFHKMLKAGWVSDPEAPPVEALTEEQRHQRLVEKVMANAAKAKPKAPPATPYSMPKDIEEPKAAPPKKVEPKEQPASELAPEVGDEELGGASEPQDDGLSSMDEEPFEEPAHEQEKGKKSKKKKG